MIKRSSFGSKYTMSQQTTLAAEAHLAEGQFLLEEETLNIENSLIHESRNQRPLVSKRGQ
jgi:hypothetical protein